MGSGRSIFPHRQFTEQLLTLLAGPQPVGLAGRSVAYHDLGLGKLRVSQDGDPFEDWVGGGGGGLPTGLDLTEPDPDEYVLDQGVVGQLLGSSQVQRQNVINNPALPGFGPALPLATIQALTTTLGSSSSAFFPLNLLTQRLTSEADVLIWGLGDPLSGTDNHFGVEAQLVAGRPTLALTGTVTTAATDQLVGVGTSFDTELEVGGRVETAGLEIGIVKSIESPTAATMTKAWVGAEAGVTATILAENSLVSMGCQQGEDAIGISSGRGGPQFTIGGGLPLAATPTRPGMGIGIGTQMGGLSSGSTKGGAGGLLAFQQFPGGNAVDGESGSGGDGGIGTWEAGNGGDGSDAGLPGSGADLRLDAGLPGSPGAFGSTAVLSGTSDTTAGALTGTGTSYLSELFPGDKIRTSTGSGNVVVSVTDDTNAIMGTWGGGDELGETITRFVESGLIEIGANVGRAVMIGGVLNPNLEVSIAAGQLDVAVGPGSALAYQLREEGGPAIFQVDTSTPTVPKIGWFGANPAVLQGPLTLLSGGVAGPAYTGAEQALLQEVMAWAVSLDTALKTYGLVF